MKRLCIFIVFLQVLTMMACPGLDPLGIQVEMPAFPPGWAAASAWELRWTDSTGELGRACLAPGSSCYLLLPRQSLVCLFLYALIPDAESGRFFRTLPFGALLPYDLQPDGVVRPDAVGGWLAVMASRLLEEGWDSTSFNWPRLRSELTTRLPDPWLLDPAAIRPLLAEGSFRADYLKTGTRHFTVRWMQAGRARLCESAIADCQIDDGSVAGSAGAEVRPLPASVFGPAPDAAGRQDGFCLLPGNYRWFWQGQEVRMQLGADGECYWTSGPLLSFAAGRADR